MYVNLSQVEKIKNKIESIHGSLLNKEVLKMDKLETKGYYPVTANIVIVIYDVIYDIDDKVKFAWDVCGKKKKPCYSKIRVDKEGRMYFNSYNHKIYLDECMRVD